MSDSKINPQEPVSGSQAEICLRITGLATLPAAETSSVSVPPLAPLGSGQVGVEVPRRHKYNAFFDFVMDSMRASLGGWPVFGLVALIVFGSSLNSIAERLIERLKEASEVSTPYLSIKLVQAEVHRKYGFNLPPMTIGEVEVLLRSPEREATLIWFGASKEDKSIYSSIFFPDEGSLEVIKELVAKGLVTVRGGVGAPKILNPSEIDWSVQQIRKLHPGDYSGEWKPGYSEWKLNSPIPQEPGPRVSLVWLRTESGEAAFDAIMEQITKELERDLCAEFLEEKDLDAPGGGSASK